MDPGIYSLFDFVGYPVALALTPRSTGGAFGLSQVDVYFMYHEMRRQQLEAEQNVRRVEMILKAHEDAVYTKRYEEWRRNWAATYSVLFSEV